MSWFSSLKEKSLKIAQLYKNELSEFMTNLNEDVGKLIGKPENDLETQFEELQIETRNEVCGPVVELAINTPNPLSLLEVLQQYITQTLTEDELKTKLSIILSNPAGYLGTDPVHLILSNRNDFTCFQEFLANQLTDQETRQGMLNANEDLFILLNNIEIQNISKEESNDLLLSRLLYALIYLIETSAPQNTLQVPQKEHEEEVPIEQGATIDAQGDALEKNSQTSEQFVVVEDGSSSSHHSNETEKVESIGQRDANNLSESDEWQIEEKAFSIEFYN